MTGLGRGRVGIGQVLGALWILAGLGLLIALALDLLASRVAFDPAVMIPLAVMLALELAIPLFLGYRLIRRPTARLARWSAALAGVALFGAVIFASDASVSKTSSPLAAPILVGCLTLLALSIVAAVRYRAPRSREAG